ncbi:EscI/YscI/HrpB family type III secretion system inner rod protein [Salmonella enterica subsp. arizonae serovar 41:z4,z23:-]|uniref:EscI/YscI/HrpB family type III secretion system inner rod protein n=1 Tax=Salmonella enterica subsp. arizonae TaxID=59203 RepID=A0A632TY09_SALER|nr:EscI/YscI/HrpB family type III secretion system inner rod protein [Salmonella enterica]EDH0569558.1 EscI/YscI/HrpB family type III secretion system inner rod protein [Salmonella enterica subsp. arizonae]EEJ5249122.1 EscI/YscI/HrpB family type III secretion system inner rod protein [Salmonella enterica subsp. enterica serovar Waycross]EGE4650894.1 EscI/YscI/HrpB family type III secretion system inner rod protein [Salmonella enterica subsp. arizonae serovar 41:z4,z23:- str. 01-0089]OSE61097.1 
MSANTQSSVMPSTDSGQKHQEQVNLFKQLLTDGMSTSKDDVLLPQVMLARQMNYMELTVDMDFLARISGSTSQALNKLVSMT